jgi:hypothetical protein
MISHGRGAGEAVSRSLTFRLNRLTEVSKGGEVRGGRPYGR